ncbi:reverse transcriptase domain-containing protein [Tanacetum coccineum]
MGGTQVIKTWVYHGEPDLPPPPPVIDNTRQPQMSDVIALLNDLSYIPPNNEQNESTQEDIGKLTDSIFNEMLEFFQYGDNNKDVHFCPMCKTSRWKDSNTPGKKVPKKVLRYFPIIPRLQRLYKSSHTANEMTWHAIGKCTEPGKMQHPVDGRAWKNFDNKYPNFAKEPRNVRLGLAADGFNPFGNLSQAYSISFMLMLLIPDPKSPGKDIDVYLRPLIDDLKVLWELKGVETINVATGQKFNMRAMVLWTINDFPARKKIAYVGHIRFLKKPHKWRRSLEFNSEIENGDPPRKFDRDQIQAQLARLPTRVKGKHPSYGGHRQGKTRLEKVGHSKWLVAWPNQKREVLEASGCVFFHTREQKKFCQFIKGVKLPDGSGSNFKHKVTDNDTNITGLKSHDCHIMMQRLLPYGLQQYLPDEVAKPIIELCSFFKQICSATLMEDDMLKAQSKVVDILCNLELIYPPAFFDIMIHLVIHLPLETLEGGPIRPWWMFPFERYMKKLKGYVRNKAKPESSIVEGYVAEEELTFSSYYFWDVTTKFNRPERNVDPPPSTCQFQVFRSLCKSIGLRLVIRFDAQELKKVIWYVLHNSPEIYTYRSQFKSKFPNKDMKEEFLDWFGSQIHQRHVDNDPGVSAASELLALACGPTPTPISVNSCVVNGMRFVVHSRDERRITQNSGICSLGGKDGEMYYGQLQEILEFLYLPFKVMLFQVKWFDTSNEGRKVKHLVLRNNMTQILTKGEAFKDDQYILATQVKQCFYLEDMARRQPHWKVVEHVNHKKFSDGGVIVVEEDPDVIHFDNSSDLPLSTSLNDLDNATLHIDGQSTEVDAPPDIIDLDEDDDIIDDEDALPHDLADSDDEDLVNVDDDDGVDVMSADVARGHGGDGGGDDRPPTHHIPTGCGGCFANRGKGTRKPNLGGRKAGRLHTRQETRNLGLKKITDDKGPGDDFVLPFLAKGLGGAEGGDLDKDWGRTTWRASGSDVPRALPWQIGMPSLPFGMIPGTKPEQLKIAKTGQRARSYAGRDLGRLLAFEIRCSTTREYPSLMDTFFVTHTVGGVFVRDQDRALYDEMLRQQRLGSNTETGVPYIEEEIMAIVRKGKQRRHLPGVSRVVSRRVTGGCPPLPQSTVDPADVEKLKKSNKSLTKQVKMMMRLFRSDDKFSQMLDQFESSPEFGGANGSGGCGDDESGGDEDDDGDEEDGDS